MVFVEMIVGYINSNKKNVDAAEVNAGFTTEFNDAFEMSLKYESKFREDYQDHSGLINAKVNF